MKLQQCTRLWDRGVHNAFTDICLFQGCLWVVFREGCTHVSLDGKIILLASCDGNTWELKAEIALDNLDLRDPKITETPDKSLVITCAGVKVEAGVKLLQSYLIYSDDGIHWQDPIQVASEGQWLWRLRFFGSSGFGVSYTTAKESTILHKLVSKNKLLEWCNPLFSKEQNGLGFPNEHDLFLYDDGDMGCLLRRDADTGTAQLGRAKPPFKVWKWQDLKKRIGGPVVYRSESGELITAVRLYDPVRTSICHLDFDRGAIQEVIALPSGGDTSYPGLVEFKGFLWCVYYSSHEDKSAIYLAKMTQHT